MAHQLFVCTVKGASPEYFLIGEVDLQGMSANFMNTSDFLLEAEFRSLLLERGVPPAGIDALVEEARQNPK